MTDTPSISEGQAVVYYPLEHQGATLACGYPVARKSRITSSCDY